MLTITSRTVQLDKISIHKVNVVVSLKKQVSLYKEIANQSPKTLPIVKLGRISNKLVVLSNFDVYFGAKQSRLNEIECEVIDFASDTEFVIEHVKLNKNPVGFNPLLLYDVLDYLQEHKIPKERALGLLQIYKTTNHNLLDLSLQSGVIAILCNLHNYLAEKLTNFTIPYYIPEFISKCDVPKQVDASKTIVTHIQSGNLSDSKFAWPSLVEIEILLKNPTYHKARKDAVVVLVPGEIPSEKEKKLAEHVVSQSKNVLAIPGNEKHPSYLINKKNNTVSIIDGKKTITSLQDTPTHKIFTLPRKAVVQLDLEESVVDVKMKCFSNVSTIIKYLQKHPDSEGVVFLK